MHERLPSIAVQAGDQQTLDGPAARHAAAKQARRKHARVVDDEKVSAPEQLRERGDRGIVDRARRSMEDEKARATALPRRLLRDQFGWKLEVEIADVHQYSGLAPGASAILRQWMTTLPQTVLAWSHSSWRM